MKNKKIQPGDVFGDLKVLRYLGSSKWECECLLCHNTDIAVTGKLNLGLKTKCTECSKKHDKRVIDLTGKILGNWKVLKYIGDRYWQCECLLCHNIYEVRGNSLRDGKSTCCVSCANKNQSKPTEDLTDRVFGDLTVKEYIKASVWKCQCSCGNYTEVRSDKLKSGEISNCGDRTKHDDTLNLKGKTFGDWEVLEYVGNQYWLCKCSCGEERKVHSWTLRAGKSTCCGSSVHKINKDKAIEFELPNIVKYGAVYIENELYRAVNKLVPNEQIIQNDTTVLNGEKLSIYLPNRGIAIDFNATESYDTNNRKPDYCQKKSIACIKRGIRLIQVYEYELYYASYREKLLNLIRNALNINVNIVYGRKLHITEISSDICSEFLDKYNLQRRKNAKIRYGAYLNGKLIGVAAFDMARFKNNSTFNYELLRLCWKPEYRVVGGFKKFLMKFIREYHPDKIISYSNIGRFDCNSYFKVGFKASYKDLTQPSYIWLNRLNNSVLTRYRTMKHILINEGYGHLGSTEDEIMKARGYIKIYNSGNLKFTLNCRE